MALSFCRATVRQGALNLPNQAARGKILRQKALGTAMANDLRKKVVVTIRRIRRMEEPDANWKRLCRIMELHLEEIATSFSARWIVSICDTYADHGSPIERRNGLLISVLVNMIRLADSSRLMRGPVQPERLLPLKGDDRPLLFSELRSLHLGEEDTLLNMAKRLDQQLSDTPHLHRLYRAILFAIHTSENSVTEFRDLCAMPERVLPADPHGISDNYGVTRLARAGGAPSAPATALTSSGSAHRAA
jgi:hypothetical protein